MRQRALLMLGVAVVLGFAALFLLRGLIHRQAGPQLATTTVVVAKVALSFGDVLSGEKLAALAWPAGSVPEGAFHTINQIIPPGTHKVVLQSMVKGEPVLANKISGSGGRATLSAIISKGMRAMTIRVNDVLGVAGFVLPGDHVDVLLTRTNERNNPTTATLLQDVRVLGIDQDANKDKDKPRVARAVTLEVTPEQVEKLTLAPTVGTLSLALRNSANVGTVAVRTVGLGDLRIGETAEIKTAKAEPSKPTSASVPPISDPMAQIRIFRGTAPTEYEVGKNGVTLSHPSKS